MQYKEVDLAYSAALIDGEGCIGVYSNKNKSLKHGRTHRLCVQIGMSDKEPVEFLYKLFGGSFHSYPAVNMGGRLRYNWSISTNKARDFLVSVLPFLKGKVLQAELAIQFQEQIRTSRGGRIKPLTLEELDIRDGFVTRLKDLKRREND